MRGGAIPRHTKNIVVNPKAPQAAGCHQGLILLWLVCNQVSTEYNNNDDGIYIYSSIYIIVVNNRRACLADVVKPLTNSFSFIRSTFFSQ